MREIWEERTVTIDGQVPEPTLSTYKARIGGDGDADIEIWLSNVLEDRGYIRVLQPDEDGEAPFKLSELLAALSDLRRVGPFDADLSPADDAIQERAAKSVERACEELAKSGNSYHDTLVADLRAAMLALIERATRG